ncbi:hypothetical protein DFS34DRAFT_628878 [Phlyctochytrium arcticum]|nr:hypothetical protein DFS34DRAFT_628878 [Phlyctochytrium arcticum]
MAAVASYWNTNPLHVVPEQNHYNHGKGVAAPSSPPAGLLRIGGSSITSLDNLPAHHPDGPSSPVAASPNIKSTLGETPKPASTTAQAAAAAMSYPATMESVNSYDSSMSTLSTLLDDLARSKNGAAPAHAACGVKVEIQLDRTVYVAGTGASSMAAAGLATMGVGAGAGVVTGRVIVTVGNHKVKVGRVDIELLGFEEMTGKSRSASSNRRILLHHALSLQNPYLAPTSLVIPGTPDEHGMWIAKAGRHILEFGVPTDTGAQYSGDPAAASVAVKGAAPTSADRRLQVLVEGNYPLPSSITEKEGRIQYILRATVHLKKLRSTKPHAPLVTCVPVMLLESAPSAYIGFANTTKFSSSRAAAAGPTAVTNAVIGGKYWFGVGRKGEVGLGAAVRLPKHVDGALMSASESGTTSNGGGSCWAAGSVGFVGVDVSNESARKVEKLSLRLIRRTKTFLPDESPTGPAGADAMNSTTTTLVSPTSKTLRPISFSRTVVAKRTWKVGGVLGVGAGGWEGVQSGEKRSIVVELGVPLHCRSIRYGTLLDVSYVLQVSVKPRGYAPLSVEMPVTILHPASLYSNLPAIYHKDFEQAPAKREIKPQQVQVQHPSHVATPFSARVEHTNAPEMFDVAPAVEHFGPRAMQQNEPFAQDNTLRRPATMHIDQPQSPSQSDVARAHTLGHAYHGLPHHQQYHASSMSSLNRVQQQQQRDGQHPQAQHVPHPPSPTTAALAIFNRQTPTRHQFINPGHVRNNSQDHQDHNNVHRSNTLPNEAYRPQSQQTHRLSQHYVQPGEQRELARLPINLETLLR